MGSELYCKELIMVKHKSIYNCESTIYFDLDPEIIKEICKFAFCYKKTDINLTVPYGGNEILAIWSNEKDIIYSINNDIPIKILSDLYALVNRSVLCNSHIRVKNNFLIESLAACHDANSMYGIVLYWQKFQKRDVLAQGACTLAVVGSMQPEHKTSEITDTVLKSIIAQLRHHICSSQLRGKARNVH